MNHSKHDLHTCGCTHCIRYLQRLHSLRRLTNASLTDMHPSRDSSEATRVPAHTEHGSDASPLLSDSDSDHINVQGLPSVRRNSVWDRHAEPSLGAVQPEAWQDLTAIRHKFFRQILGLNPFRTSYFALYRPLDDFGSRAFLALGVFLAIAAGLPLPLIGIILGRIINNFPPPQDELKTLLMYLMIVAAGYFAVTWGWAVSWAVIGEKVSRKTREQLLHRALGMDMTYFDTVSPDMTSILTEKTQTIQLGTSEKVGLFLASISYFVAAFTVGFMLNARLTAVL
jgi:ATP-binding cassette subfamily B (MDR/TAP) protein 1